MRGNALAALQYRDFRFFLGTQFTYTVAVLVQEVVLGYRLYEVTGDPLSLGLIGLFEAIPYLILALFGGHVADRFDKRKIALICIAAMMGISLFLLVGMDKLGQSQQSRYIVYAAVFMIGISRGFMGPAWSSIKAFLVDKEHYSNAASWSSQFWQAGTITGPAVAGFMYAYMGLHNTLLTVLILLGIAFVSAFMIKKKSKVEHIEKQNLWQSLKEGYHFVINSKILIYAIALDGNLTNLCKGYTECRARRIGHNEGRTRRRSGTYIVCYCFLSTYS
jgi:MFS family permease